MPAETRRPVKDTADAGRCLACFGPTVTPGSVGAIRPCRRWSGLASRRGQGASPPSGADCHMGLRGGAVTPASVASEGPCYCRDLKPPACPAERRSWCSKPSPCRSRRHVPIEDHEAAVGHHQCLPGVGWYRAAAQLCGITDKTVKRVSGAPAEVRPRCCVGWRQCCSPTARRGGRPRRRDPVPRTPATSPSAPRPAGSDSAACHRSAHPGWTLLPVGIVGARRSRARRC